VLQKHSGIHHAQELFAGGEMIFATNLLPIRAGTRIQETAKSTPLTCLRNSLN